MTVVYIIPALTVPPSPGTAGRSGNVSSRPKRPLRPRRGSKGDSVKGGGTPDTGSPCRERLAALEAGFSSFKTDIASIFADFTGRFTTSRPPIPMGHAQKAG